MEKTVSTETDGIHSNSETESIIANTRNRLSDHKIQNSPRTPITSDGVACQIKAGADSLVRQLKRLCEKIRDLEDEQSGKRHLKTTSFRANILMLGSSRRSDSNAIGDAVILFFQNIENLD